MTCSPNDILVLIVIDTLGADAIGGGTDSLGDLLLMIALVLILGYLLDIAEYRVPAFRRLMRHGTIALVEDGRMLRRNMRHEMVTRCCAGGHRRSPGSCFGLFRSGWRDQHPEEGNGQNPRPSLAPAVIQGRAGEGAVLDADAGGSVRAGIVPDDHRSRLATAGWCAVFVVDLRQPPQEAQAIPGQGEDIHRNLQHAHVVMRGLEPDFVASVAIGIDARHDARPGDHGRQGDQADEVASREDRKDLAPAWKGLESDGKLEPREAGALVRARAAEGTARFRKHPEAGKPGEEVLAGEAEGGGVARAAGERHAQALLRRSIKGGSGCAELRVGVVEENPIHRCGGRSQREAKHRKQGREAAHRPAPQLSLPICRRLKSRLR